MKNSMKDYITGFRPGRSKQFWQQFWQKDTAIAPFFTVYFSLAAIASGLYQAEGKELWYNFVVIGVLLLPMTLVYFLQWMHPVKPCKMMYLCPMDREERRRHIYGSYYFGMLFHMLLMIAGVCILFFVTYCSFLSVIAILLNDLTIAMQIPPDNAEQSGGVSGILLVPFAFISNALQLVAITDDQVHTLWVEVILFAVFFVLQLPLALRYRKYVKRKLEAAVLFEETLI